jgi:hypothetical protein
MEPNSSFDDGPVGGGGGGSSGGMDGDCPAPSTNTSSGGGGATTAAANAAASAAAAAAAANVSQENVAELQFGGPEFEDMTILSNAQVAVILQVSASTAVSKDEELHEVYRKTQKYVNRFNSMFNPEKEHQELVDELDNLQECVPCLKYLVSVSMGGICFLLSFSNLTDTVFFCSLGVHTHTHLQSTLYNTAP